MKRVTVAGLDEDAPSLLDGLQAMGCMHLIPLRVDQGEGPIKDEAQRAREALRYLLGSPIRRRELLDGADFDFRRVLEETLENRRLRIETQHQIDSLRERIEQVAPWGDFELPALESIGGIRLWFYVVPHFRRADIRPGPLSWLTVHTDGRRDYVVLLSEDEPPEEAMPVPRSRVGTRSLSTLQAALERAQDRFDDLQAERGALTRWIRQLLRQLGKADDEVARGQALRQGLRRDRVLALQGWVPEDKLPVVQAFCRRHELAVLVEDPGPEDEPPVLLRNGPSFAPGEDLVGFYQLPGYRDWDPSALVYVAFVFFFAVILADAGYASLVGLLTAMSWRRLGRSDSGLRLRRMGIGISVIGIVYGILAGSYFGIDLTPGSLASSLQLLDVNDFDAMMPLSIGVGIAHLVAANLMGAWVKRRRLSALSSLGWVAVLVGGFVVYLGVELGLPVAAVGLGAVFLFTSERPFRGIGNLGWRAVDGLLGLTGLSRAFGDALSYLRLFALGLSSASLAATFNQLGTELIGTGPGIGLVLALVVLIIGHGLNFVLGMVGGVVHGLRLNVIELYNWSVFGEGRPFSPLRRRSLEEVRGENRPQEI